LFLIFFTRGKSDLLLLVNKNIESLLIYLVFKILSRIGNTTNVFADDLEVIVKLNKKTGWKIKSPTH
jgi:hypothetical protein